MPRFDNAKMFLFEEKGGVKKNLRTGSDATEFLEDLEETHLLEILDQVFMVIIGE